MSKLLRFLRPYAAAVLGILAALTIQAMTELALPTYTSDIVNVGIQQSGVEEEVPYYLTEEAYQKLLLFTEADQRQLVETSYKKSNRSFSYDKEVMELKASVKNSDTKKQQLKKAMEVPMLLSLAAESKQAQKAGLQTEQDQVTEGGQAGQAQMNEADQTGEGASAENLQMAQKLQEQIRQAKEKIKAMPESMTKQSVAQFIKKNYETIGIDVGEKSTSYILKTGRKMLLLAGVGMTASILAGFAASRVAAGVGQRLRSSVFQKVVSFSGAEMNRFSTASLITRSTNDINQIQTLLVMFLRLVLYAPVLALGGVWKVIHTDVGMSWIIGLGVGAILLVVLVLFSMVIPRFKLVQKQIDRLNLVSREILTGLQVIRVFGNESYEEKRFDTANKDMTKTFLFINRAMTFMMPIMMLIMNLITLLIVWVGGHGIEDGTMQVGDMMAFIQYTMQIIISFLMLCMVSVMLPRAAVSAERVDEVLRSENQIVDKKEVKPFVSDRKGEVRFENVSFRYPGAEEDVLSQISFVAKKGETTAFIGSTGSGKSTLVNLIPRFYDVTEGRILVDGEDVRDVSQKELRDRIGYVPQKGVLFSGTIASNILYGEAEKKEERMREAARTAQATEFIEEQENGYEREISQGGGNVSGGQKQRLSIARAIAKQPEIYIFDDSFSALDYKTDQALRRALKKDTKDSTVLLVAQRISTILQADQIIVLEDGQMVGKGTHEELLKNCETYYQIAVSQLSEEELSKAGREAR